jgi:hypothetical protein
MKCPYVIKICTKCNKILIANNLNFHKQKGGLYGLNSICKKCRNKKRKNRYKQNKSHELKINRLWRINNIDYFKNRYNINKETILKKQKQYNEKHKKEISKRNKEYRKNNPQVDFNAHNKRRQLKENQGRGITKEQWREMMDFFEWKCAYSDKYIGGDKNKNIRSIDHIIALDNGGLNEPWNCVPMVKSYNSSKKDKNMEEWYIQQEFYSEERLIKIYAWIEYAYRKWKPRRKGNKKKNKGEDINE